LLGSLGGQGGAGSAGQDSVLETVLRTAGQGGAQPGGGDVLGGLLGGLMGQSQGGQGQSEGLGLDDVMNAAAHFIRAKQAGSDNVTAVTQAAMGALMGSQPLQSNSPRAAAGGLLAQSVLGALLRRK
jgi:hypothetical protein